MNQFNISCNVATNINGGTQTQPLNNRLNISSSVGPSLGQLIPTGSWVSLNTGSIVNMRIGIFVNNDISSSIYISAYNTGSAGISGSLLYVDDFVILTNITGSKVYATATGSNSPAVLNYILSDY